MVEAQDRDWANWMTPELRKKIDDRVRLYRDKFMSYRVGLNAPNKEGINGLFMNPAILREVVERYFEDLEKDRLENRCGLFNGYRQAAFILKWIMRLRPIQTPFDTSVFLHANQNFALSLAFVHLRRDPATVDPFLYKFLLYTLRFNALDEGLLMSLCVSLNPNLSSSEETKNENIE